MAWRVSRPADPDRRRLSLRSPRGDRQQKSSPFELAGGRGQEKLRSYVAGTGPRAELVAGRFASRRRLGCARDLYADIGLPPPPAALCVLAPVYFGKGRLRRALLVAATEESLALAPSRGSAAPPARRSARGHRRALRRRRCPRRETPFFAPDRKRADDAIARVCTRSWSGRHTASCAPISRRAGRMSSYSIAGRSSAERGTEEIFRLQFRCSLRGEPLEPRSS